MFRFGLPCFCSFSCFSSIYPPCSNTVVYNLLSACVLCQGGVPSAFADWAAPCAASAVAYGSYPDTQLAADVGTPRWAYVALDDNGAFDVAHALAGEHQYLQALQILYSRSRYRSPNFPCGIA